MIPTPSAVRRGFSELIRRTPFGRHARQADTEQARILQERLLPREVPQFDGIDIACAWRPSAAVSGDYFDVIPLDDDRIAVCTADVTGKGLSAATLMSDLQAAVRSLAPESATPADLCSRVNRALCGQIPIGKYVTMFYGVLDRAGQCLHYENAGHCLPVLIRADGCVEFPASFSGVLGLFSHWLYQNQQIQLRPGDTLLLLTDGVIEAEGRRGEEFGYQRLIALVQSARSQGAERLSKEILAAVSHFCRGNFRDDASLIVLSVK